MGSLWDDVFGIGLADLQSRGLAQSGSLLEAQYSIAAALQRQVRQHPDAGMVRYASQMAGLQNLQSDYTSARQQAMQGMLGDSIPWNGKPFLLPKRRSFLRRLMTWSV